MNITTNPRSLRSAIGIDRRALAENHKRRVEAKRAKAQSDRIAKIRDRQLASVRVTLEDSRKAGNCIEGSLVFAEKRLGISREEIIAGGHLFSIAGATLLSHSQGEQRAIAALHWAWMRETTVSI